MKNIFLSLLMLVGATGFSQETRISVSAQNKNITASPGEDNSGKLLALQKAITPSEAYLVAKVDDEEKDTGWNRNFVVYDNEDSEVTRLIVMKENTYGILLKNLLPELQSGKEYSLYTTVLPEDPQKLMEVRVARQLVCKIQVD